MQDRREKGRYAQIVYINKVFCAFIELFIPMRNILFSLESLTVRSDHRVSFRVASLKQVGFHCFHKQRFTYSLLTL